MNRRKGVTLVEVLVAIFIMGIGLLALLTLFPLGALNMKQAIKDDRTGHAKETAAAIATVLNVRRDTLAIGTIPSVVDTMLGINVPPLTPIDVTTNSPSYPVFVDPIGYNCYPVGDPRQLWLAGQDGQNGQPVGIPRRSVSFLETQDPNLTNATYKAQQLIRWLTFLDEMDFPREVAFAGRPCPDGGVVVRESKYSYAYLVRQPKAIAPSGTGPYTAPVELTVVVYDNRPYQIPGGPPGGEDAYNAAFGAVDPKVITVNWGTNEPRPEVVPGNWVLDATLTPVPRGFFYRVVTVNDNGPNSIVIEVENPVRAGGTGRLVIMRHVVEVFPRGIL